MPGLRVLAGPSLEALEPISPLVNTNQTFKISSDIFDGEILVNIKGFTNSHTGDVRESEYFSRKDRQGITWSVQVQGRFLKPYSANDILFGNTFDRPLNLPWGSGAALKFMAYVDPVLEHDLTSQSKPWALSPLISTMPHFAHSRLDRDLQDIDSGIPPFPTEYTSISDDTSNLYLASVSSSPCSSTSSLSSSSSSASSKSSSKSKIAIRRKQRANQNLATLQTASQRQAFFSSEENRRMIVFSDQDVITADFCYGFLEFNPSLALRLPGGISFDLMRYWDGQPVRFVCCERNPDRDAEGDPWGRIFWCIVIEQAD
ncbi:uncharacterized protein EV420DRAFT_1620875 [Desarmillaria tabescens]|uniref:Domain of unknown function at the cortex 1 domain-containing protein n=1 Tax=Armillaria tabescens TaxID=1929756 RepID=A0AA39KBH5_ARMTA|nr:uncharacterized protein EV420DRAFT_1620875 [Desarmillaria tabescens]KAK0458092.1 hypothetical protein EV420DRAFT_1620875 [Desarmillaria tabescens]